MIAVVLSWDGFLEPLTNMMHDLLGNPLLIGATIFIIVTFFAMMLLIPFEALVVIWIPTIALLWIFIPGLQIVLGICIGFIIGLGLVKWFRR